MGDYFIDGYVNGKKDYNFKAPIYIDDNNQYTGNISYNPKTLGKFLIRKTLKIVGHLMK